MADLKRPLPLFRALSDKDVEEFRKWARENYIPHSLIKGVWHPEIQKECAKINSEGNSA